MKGIWVRTGIFAFIFVFVIGCAKVPITGRRQMNLLPESQLMSMSLTQYNSFLSENPPVTSSSSSSQQVKRVGEKIAAAVTQYMKDHGMSKRIANYKWEFNLVNENVANAWCMPGGKVVVYQGIMPIAQDDDGLAVVMGHEIAHAIARHGNERMSTQIGVQAGGIALGTMIQDKPQLTQQLFSQAFGLGSSLGTLKFSRSHESEADKLGMVFMALAGYNPEAAIGFWQRMSQAGGGGTPEFLSTHPSPATRISDIKEFMAEAKSYQTK